MSTSDINEFISLLTTHISLLFLIANVLSIYHLAVSEADDLVSSA